MYVTSGSTNLDAAIALLYELCVSSSSMEGVSVLLSWLNHAVTTPPAQPTMAPNDHYHSLGPPLSRPQHPSPPSSPGTGGISSGVSAEVLHCIAAVLWNTQHDITGLITDTLFR